MEINEVEKLITDFASKRASFKGISITPELSYIHLTEELGEVARQLSNKKLRPEKFDEENLKEEIIDVLLETIILANVCNVNLSQEINKKINALYKKHNFQK